MNEKPTSVPEGIGYSDAYALFAKERYGAERHWAVSGDRVVVPIFIAGRTAHILIHSHLILRGGLVDFCSFGYAIRKATGANLVLADFVIEGSAGRPNCTNSLPLEVFILSINGISYDELFSSYSESTRRYVRRVRSSKLSINESSGALSRAEYAVYKIHQLSLGTPPKPKLHFDLMASAFRDNFIVFSVKDGDEVVGVNITIRSAGHLWMAHNVSLPDKKHLKVNYLLYDEMIVWASKNGIEFIDLGGSSTRENNIHNQFKASYGAQAYPLWRLRDGSLGALLFDWYSRKKRSFLIRVIKILNLLW